MREWKQPVQLQGFVGRGTRIDLCKDGADQDELLQNLTEQCARDRGECEGRRGSASAEGIAPLYALFRRVSGAFLLESRYSGVGEAYVFDSVREMPARMGVQQFDVGGGV